MSFELIDTREQQADIKVVGVGGCGNNAIEYMIKNKVGGVDFICVNTDAQDLKNNPVNDNRKCNIGHNITRGLGGILTVAVVTKPWKYEKKKRMKNAEIGIEDLRSKVDSLIIIPNDKLCADKDMPLSEAKNQSNAVLERAVGGIAELITKPGEINLDFADVKSVMSNAGSTMMGSGIGEGIDRAEDAIRQAIASPLLEDVNVQDAKGLLINITSDGSLTNGEFEAIGEHIGSLVDEEEADVIVGTTIDESLEDRIKVTVVATGMNNTQTLKTQENINEKIVDIKLDPVISNKEIISEQEPEILVNNFEDEIINQEENYISENTYPNYAKQDQYDSYEKNEENIEKKEKIKIEKNIEYKKNSNGELDLDFLDIPAFLRKQAD